MVMAENKDEIKNENIEQEENVAKFSSKAILAIECVICFTSLAFFLALVMIASYCDISNILRLVLIFVGVADLLVSCFTAFYLEVKAGCHVCSKCGYKHKPSYFKALIAPHVGWTRLLKCPKCGEVSWQKKKF